MTAETHTQAIFMRHLYKLHQHLTQARLVGTALCLALAASARPLCLPSLMLIAVPAQDHAFMRHMIGSTLLGWMADKSKHVCIESAHPDAIKVHALYSSSTQLGPCMTMACRWL